MTKPIAVIIAPAGLALRIVNNPLTPPPIPASVAFNLVNAPPDAPI